MTAFAVLLALGPVFGQTTPRKPASVNLLALIKLPQHTLRGAWTFDRKVLSSDPKARNLLVIPYKPPTEYDLDLVVERTRGTGNLNLVVVAGSTQPSVVMDGDYGKTSGVNRIDGKLAGDNPATYKGKVLKDSGANSVHLEVRKDGLKLVVNGKQIFAWKGEADRLSLSPRDELPNRTVLGLAAFEAGFQISKFTLTPIAGTGSTVRLK